jgi:hypothetical protein
MTTKNYTNIDERYGEQVEVSIEDYRELNPTGKFTQDEYGIYEVTDNGKTQVAEAK